MTGVLAISWEPELRGLLTVILAVVTLCGSIYMVMATNIGARLGFLVAMTGLIGWMFLMGVIWLIYGIGLRGPEPSWQAVPGRTVLQDTDALFQAGLFERRVDVTDEASFPEKAAAVEEQFSADGWTQLGEADPAFGQAGATAGELLEETGAFAAGEFQVVNVFDIGGERYPKLGDALDLFAFFHKPHYAVVEVAAIESTRQEPGRAPPTPVIDETRQRQYVYMIRDPGARRQPAAVLTVGAGIIFGALCWLLHRRERFLRANISAASRVPATTS